MKVRARPCPLRRNEPSGASRWHEIDADLLAVPPIRRDLKDGRAGKPLVWVKSAASRNSVLPKRAITSAETPDKERNSTSSPPSVSGTSAGRGSTIFRPNFRARS